MTIPFSGGRACRAIRYRCAREPVAMFYCHCRDGQHSSGGPSLPLVIVPAAAFERVQRTPRFYGTTSADGGRMNRGFCPDCGSPVFGTPDPNPDPAIVSLTASLLDDPSSFRSLMHIFTCDAHPWHLLDPQLPQFPEYRP
jgi:hypothetical protein